MNILVGPGLPGGVQVSVTGSPICTVIGVVGTTSGATPQPFKVNGPQPPLPVACSVMSAPSSNPGCGSVPMLP